MGLRVGDEEDGKKWWPECIGRRWVCDMSVETLSMVERAVEVCRGGKGDVGEGGLRCRRGVCGKGETVKINTVRVRPAGLPHNVSTRVETSTCWRVLRL